MVQVSCLPFQTCNFCQEQWKWWDESDVTLLFWLVHIQQWPKPDTWMLNPNALVLAGSLTARQDLFHIMPPQVFAGRQTAGLTTAIQMAAHNSLLRFTCQMIFFPCETGKASEQISTMPKQMVLRRKNKDLHSQGLFCEVKWSRV